jgi:hypothetical protein
MLSTKRLHIARELLALVSLLSIISACSTSTGPAPTHIEHTPNGGFTVTQDVRVGVGVRRDFDEVLRLLAEEKYELGIERARAVTEAAPQLTAGHINLGIAYGKVEDWSNAEASIVRALELSPRHPVAHNELGMIRS